MTAYLMRLFYRLFTSVAIFKNRGDCNENSLHIIIPHCTNWALTRATTLAFLKLTRRPCVVTIINSYDASPDKTDLDKDWYKDPRVAIVQLHWSAVGLVLRKILKTRVGSEENGQALDLAIAKFPDFQWAFMAHSDSAPLARYWDDAFFDALQGNLIIGNCRDRIRINAAHASGTLFNQKAWKARNGSMLPIYKKGDMILDVGDPATELLWDLSWGKVPVLPNTQNFPELLNSPALEGSDLKPFAETGSCLTFSGDQKEIVFGHLGRGTPRNLQDAQYSNRPPVNYWIDIIERQSALQAPVQN